MQATSRTTNPGAELDGDIDRYTLLETVSSLRQDLFSLTSDLQQVLQENVKLRDELERLRSPEVNSSRPGPGRGMSDLHRIKGEVDELSKLYEQAVSRRRERRPRLEGRSSDREGRLRQMLLMMIMAEIF